MTDKPHGAPQVRSPTFDDFKASLGLGLKDFKSAPALNLFFANFFVVTGLVMGWITAATGQTFWLVLAALGFPLVGTLAAVGFYEISRRREQAEPLEFGTVVSSVWSNTKGQLPWFATIIVVIFLFWFFIGHMIFALFLGLSPMTNVSTSLDVFWTTDGLTMIGVGSIAGSIFALLVFSMSVLGIPMLIDRDIDFMTAMLTSIVAVRDNPLPYIIWGAFVGIITLISMVPMFLGLFITMPILGHATWHLYRRVTTDR
jgi:uncharacterized membrane protein